MRYAWRLFLIKNDGRPIESRTTFKTAREAGAACIALARGKYTRRQIEEAHVYDREGFDVCFDPFRKNVLDEIEEALA